MGGDMPPNNGMQATAGTDPLSALRRACRCPPRLMPSVMPTQVST